MTGSDSTGPTSWRKVAGVIMGLTAIVSVLLVAFALPSLNLAPRNIPVLVSGDPASAAAIAEKLAKAQPGAFNITVVPEVKTARTRILNREAYGALVVEGSGVTLLTASAASPAVAQMLIGMATGFAGQSNLQVQTEDIRPMPEADPRGLGLAAGALPLVAGGIAAAAMLSLFVVGMGRRIAGTIGFSVIGGLVITAIIQYWFGSVDGNYLLTAGAVGLSIAATSLFILGLFSVLGRPGIGIGAALTMLLGNPLSGLNSAPELLPAGWGALGQLLPPGASATVLRSTAFFDGAGAGTSIVILGAWIAIGLALCLAGSMRVRPSMATDAELAGSATTPT